MPVQPIPDGYHSVTPYIIVDDAKAAIAFYAKAFGASEVLRLDGPEGKLSHAEIKIGDSHVMLADEHPEYGAISPKTLGGTASSLMIYCEDADALFQQAIAAGATEKRPLQDQVLRRPLRRCGGPLRPQLEPCHAQGGFVAGGN